MGKAKRATTLLGLVLLGASVSGLAADEVSIVSATYGSKISTPSGSTKVCDSESVTPVNLTDEVKSACGTDNTTCQYTVPWPANDPAQGCYKNFKVVYRCGTSTVDRVIDIGGIVNEAAKQTVTIDCDPTTGINVVEATYGAQLERVLQDCKTIETGNATSFVQGVCNGEQECDYLVDTQVIGDPSFGCKKSFEVKYTCGDSDTVKTATAPMEADGKIVQMSCPSGTVTTGVRFGVGEIITTHNGAYSTAMWEYALNGITDGQIYKVVAQYWTDPDSKSAEQWPSKRAEEGGTGGFSLLQRYTTYKAQLTVTLVVDRKVYQSDVIEFRTP